jgi:hypothetical protein
MVENEGVPSFGIMPVKGVHGPAVLAEKVRHDEVLSCGNAFQDQAVHRPVPGQGDLQGTLPPPAVPGNRRRRDAVEVRVTYYVKKGRTHISFSSEITKMSFSSEDGVHFPS